MPTNNLIPNYVTKRDEQHFFLNGVEVPGVQSCDIEYSQPVAPLKHIGCGGKYFAIPASRFSAQSNVSALLISNDPFISLTGYSGVNGYLVKTYGNTAQNFSFVSGYLTNYTVNCSIGQIPQINAAFDVFGEAGKVDSSDSPRISADFSAISSNTATAPLRVAGANSITLNLSDFSTNRVQSFNIAISCPRSPQYIVGQRFPIDVQMAGPIEVSVDFAMDLNDYNARKASLFPIRDTKSNLSIILNDIATNSPISSHSFDGMTFAGESQRTNVNNSVSVITKYAGFYGR